MGDSQQLQSFTIPGANFGYTGAPIDDLTSFENTLAVTLFDESGSTRAFSRQMELAVKTIVEFLRMSPRADNLIYAHYHFDNGMKEIMGWTPLAQIDPDRFDGCWAGGGCTNLWYSEERVLSFMRDYAQQMGQKRYVCNGILCTLTDGSEYSPPYSEGAGKHESDVKKAFAQTVVCEDLESIVSILIGINPDQGIQDELQKHAAEVGYTRYLPVEKADAKSLAKIAEFISKSIVSQSQSLGTKGPSTDIGSLTF